MKPYQQRVVKEKSDLDENVFKLKEFLASKECAANIHDPELKRLKLQLKIMVIYSDILSERIDNFE